MTTMTRCLIGVMCCCALLTACSKSDDAAAIKMLIETGAKLAEQKSTGDLIQLTTKDFVAIPGQQDKDMVRRILFVAFMRYGKFSIYYPQFEIEMADNGTHAVVAFPLAVVRQDHKLLGWTEFYNDPQGWMETVGEKADLYLLKMLLRKQDGDWLVAQAELHGYRYSYFSTK